MKKKSISEKKKFNRVRIAVKIVLGVLAILFCVALSVAMIQFVSETARMESWMQTHPIIGRFAYVAMSMFQVIVAVVPGEPVELAGGYVFGALQGTLLYLTGATIGSLLIFILVRKYGNGLVELFFEKEKIENLRFLKNSKKRNILLSLFFILPGTPKDLLCYFAGLTDISFKVWVWVCSLGRLPSIITSMLGGDALETKNYTSAIVVLAITLFVSAIGLLIYQYICNKHEATERQKKLSEEIEVNKES